MGCNLRNGLFMETQEKYLIFTTIFMGLVMVIAIIIVLDIILIFINRRLKHKNEVLKLQHRFEKEIEKTKMEVTEQVLKDIADELHDNIGQTLTLASMAINKKDIEETNSIIKQAVFDVRNLSHVLKDDPLNYFNLGFYLTKLKARIERNGIISVNLNIQESGISREKEILILRIIQELINNTLKHSKSDRIDISITNIPNDTMEIKYKDYGIGIVKHSTDGVGITSIKQRLSLLKASWTIQANSGTGFFLHAIISKS